MGSRTGRGRDGVDRCRVRRAREIACRVTVCIFTNDDVIIPYDCNENDERQQQYYNGIILISRVPFNSMVGQKRIAAKG